MNRTVRVQLLQTHTHDGVVYNEGDVIEVSMPTADWLAEQRIGKAASRIPFRIPSSDEPTGDDDHEQ